MPRERKPEVERGDREERAEERNSMLLVPVWIGIFMGSWWAIARLILLVQRSLRGSGALRAGATALAGARDVVAPVLGLLLATYAIVLLGVLRRRLRGEPLPCEAAEEQEEPEARSGVPRRLRDRSSIDRVERELARGRRAERGAVRRATLALNDRLMVGALRRRGYNDDIGCSGIVLILVAATVALPFVAEGISSFTGFEIAGQLGALLWFALVYAGFCLRWVWKRSRDQEG
jgi:hypothetical protein